MPPVGVSDEVWRQLNPHAGQLSARAFRRLIWTAAIIVAAAIVLAVAGYAGLLVPRLVAVAYQSTATPGEFSYGVTIENQNRWMPARIIGVGRDGPGLLLLQDGDSVPRTVAPGETMSLTLAYRVTDCAVVPDELWPVPVRVERPWGIQTVNIYLPGEISDDALDSYEVPWQRAAANAACGFRN